MAREDISSAKASVAIVNDDPLQLKLLSAMLEQAGFHVSSFLSAEDALRQTGNSMPPDLIITDLNMPGIDGWRFCRLLRSPEYPVFHKVPILVVSATFSGEETEHISSELGANAFLSLPADQHEILSAVEHLLELQEAPECLRRVLIVDDSKTFLSAMKKTFEKNGYGVDTALTGEEAARKFAAGKYEVVILDYHLPDVEGDTLLVDFLKQRPQTVYLMITSDPQPDLALQWLKAGASAYVRKPFDPRYLLEVCEKARREKSLLGIADLIEKRSQVLQKKEEHLQRMTSRLPGVVYQSFTHPDGTTEIRHADGRIEDIFGVKPEPHRLFDQFMELLDPRDLEKLLQSIQESADERKQWDFEGRIRKPTGETVWIKGVSVPEQSDGETVYNGIIVDITERKRTEEVLQLRLQLTQYSATHSLDELLQQMLDEVCRITDSPIGFYHFVEGDQKTLTLQAWSTRTLNEFCTAKGKGMHYSIDKAGVWADCIRERCPVIHNNYDALPHRKGMPPGHAPVIRELLIPVLREDKAVAVLGIGNKPFDYTQQDVETVSFLADVAWEITLHKKADEEMERLNEILETTNDMVSISMPNGKIAYINTAGRHLLGMDMTTDCTQCVISDLHPAWAAKIILEEGIPAAIEKGMWQGETAIRCKHGREIPVSQVILSHRSKNGDLSHMSTIMRDISEQKKSEELLQFNADRTQTLLRLNQMTESHLNEITNFVLEEAVRLTKSKIGYLAFLNEDESILTMHSWSQSAMAECTSIEKPFVYPVATTGLWGEAVRQRRPIITNDYSAPNPWKKGYPDGHVQVYRHMNVPIFSSSRIVLVAGVGNKESAYDEHDVQQLTLLMEGMWRLIERKRVHEALREKELWLSTILEALPTGVMIIDAETRTIMDVNPAMAHMAGESKEHIIGQICHRFVCPADVRKCPICDLGQVVDRSERIMLTASGQKKQILKTVHPTVLGGRNVLIENLVDIEDKKQLEEQLHQAQKMEAVGQLAGGIAHDFNNILAAILGYSELALDEVPQDHPLYEYVCEIAKAGNRARDLTRQLLTFARKQELTLQPLNLNRVVLGIEKMLRRTLRENVDIKVKLSPEIGAIQGDPGQIEQIILNLAVNAQDAMPDGGILVIETVDIFLDEAYAKSHQGIAVGAYVLLTLSDSGAGMDKETLARIFEPFFTTKGAGKGTGLGLSTVYGIVQQHKGHIWAYSEVGEGSTFRVYFPRLETASDPEPSLEHVTESRGGTETVLVVEDEKNVRNLTCTLLRRLGYTVLEAANAQTALEIAKNGPHGIHLVLTDVIMPDMNGRELYSHLSALNANIKVLYMSGYTADVITHHHALEPGVQLIQKPFTFITLSQKVREVLDQR
ncbi:MAG TPA: response regulator [Candidatus Hydrogenedentes bacterium]|nr:response regulator [Candidatus Hydrogenedentota bacterium]